MSDPRPIRISEGVTFTPKRGVPKPRKPSRRRSSRVVTRRVELTPPPLPDPTVAEELGQTLNDLVAYEVLSGVRRPDRKKLIRAAAGYVEGVAAQEVLVALVDDGWTLTEALHAAWNVPDADYQALITAMVQRLGMTFPDVMAALRSIRIGESDLKALIDGRDLGATPRRYR